MLQKGFRNLQVWRRHLPLLTLLAVLFANSHARAMAPERHCAGETLTGTASWYGAEQGHHTASGERFNPGALTAAMRHLPFNSVVRVTNQQNGLSVDVRINDRGPWTHGRLIDLSSAAADVLQMKRAGTVPVTVEVIKLGPPTRHAHAE